MKPNIPRTVRHLLVLLPVLGGALAPLVSSARDKEVSSLSGNRDDMRVPELGTSGRAGIIEEFNLGPPGTDIRPWEEEDTRVLSGRVVELQGRTLYVERNGVVVPLEMRALRITKPPQPGQHIIAEYQVDRTQNVALSLAGEVASPTE